MKRLSAKVLIVLGAATLLAGCETQVIPGKELYWQRIEAHSALYLTGPKAQQQLEMDISGCVREIDELVELEALRDTLPPETRNEYLRALDASGDVAHWDTPTRLKDRWVDHSDYHDFESCMASAGWERVKYARYETDAKAHKTKQDTQDLRKWGVRGDAARLREKQYIEETQGDFDNLNE